MARTTTISLVAQDLEVLPERYAVSGDDVVGREALVRVSAPDGLAVVRRDPEGTWRALFSGATAHELEAPGMTVSVLAPLAAAEIPVFVASTTTADLVLVPALALERAAATLREAGHTVRWAPGR